MARSIEIAASVGLEWEILRVPAWFLLALASDLISPGGLAAGSGLGGLGGSAAS